ncbi:GNAT family N-acetyltransferase [Flindersiella endophytica]
MISLRTATRDDIPVLADVLANVQAQDDPAIEVGERRTEIAAWIEDGFGRDEPESVLSIIEVDGVAAGRFRVVRFADRIFLGGIQIHPAFQGRGIGTQLITALIEECRSTGKPLTLDVDRDNLRARSLYERLGFEQTAESEQDFRLTYHPAYYYGEHHAAYERLAREGKSEWDELFGEAGFSQRAFLESALAKLAVPPGARVLEYGCGTGRAARFLAAAGFRVHAVDLIPEAIELARRFAAEGGFEIDFEVRDICRTTFDTSYALVVDGFCLQSIVTDDDRAKLFAAVRSALDDDGHYLITTATYDPARAYEAGDEYDPATGIVLSGGVPHRRHLRPEALRAELEAHGFRVLSQQGAGGGELICSPTGSSVRGA